MFVSVQGILLKVCFSVGLHPEKHSDPWGLCHEKQENDKKWLLILFLLKRADVSFSNVQENNYV